MNCEDKGIECMIFIVCEKRETIKKIKKNCYFNKILRKIDNLR